MSEPTRYTRCWHCSREFPLREIREHAAACKIRQQSFPTVPRFHPSAFKADWESDTFSLTIDTAAIQRRIAEDLREVEDKIAEPVILDWLRNRGFSIEKCDGGCNPGDGPEEECSLHGRPVAEVWEALAQRTQDAEALRAQLDEARALLREFIDDEPCQLDHHGGCQTHGFLEPDEGETCHVDRARTFLCECSSYSEDRGGGHFELMLDPEPDCPLHGEGASRG